MPGRFSGPLGPPTTTHARKGKNLAQNPDFEDGNIQPWTKWVEVVGARVVVNMMIDKKEHLKGKKLADEG